VREALGRGEVVGLSVGGPAGEVGERLLGELAGETAPLLPVHYEAGPGGRPGQEHVFILGGQPLPAGTTPAQVREELRRLNDVLRRLEKSGLPLGQALAEVH
jgi:hypothetical protein